MIELNAKNELEARPEAIEISQQHPGQYVLVVACFGLFATVHKRLPAQAPSDSPFGWYVLNGKVRGFTEAQQIANQEATPTLA